MLRAHETVGLLVLLVAAVAAVLGGVSLWRRRDPGGAVRHLLALVQTAVIGQVGLGLLLLSDGRRAEDDLHYLYGFLSLGVALSPWMYAPAEPRRRLAWFVGATLVAGALAARAYMTAP